MGADEFESLAKLNSSMVRGRVELDRGEGIPIENIEKELLRWLDEKPETLTTSLGSGTF